MELVELVDVWRGWLHRARASSSGGGVGSPRSGEADRRDMPRFLAR